MKLIVKEFLLFGIKQFYCITFGVLLVIGFILTIHSTHRYDILFIYAIACQYLLYKSKFETIEDIKVITIFHLIGLSMELIEVGINGSWSYTSTGLFFIFSVPIFTGFMYASVGSYISRAFDVFKLNLTSMPSNKTLLILSIAIYANFILNNYLPDIRWVLIPIIIILFWKSKLTFTPHKRPIKFNLTVSFVLIAFFIWIAENIATYLGIWTYPNQIDGWQMVHLSKISSWMLLTVVSVNLVYCLKYSKSN